MFVKLGWPCVPGFLKSLLFTHWYVYLSVCLSAPRALITSALIWCDIGHV